VRSHETDEPGHQRAPAVQAKLDESLAALAELRAEIAAHALAAAEGRPGAAAKLTMLRSKIDAEQSTVDELQAALRLALRLDRQAAVSAVCRMRIDQLASFRAAMAERGGAMAAVLKAAADMAAAYGDYSEATLLAATVVPSGTTVPQMSIGGVGLYGAAFGPCERLILAELYRLAPDRRDGVGRFVLPFAKPPSEQFRGNHTAVPAGIDELRAADEAIIADITKQIENLDAAAMRFALASTDRKDAA
jgi:hypothetical protein